MGEIHEYKCPCCGGAISFDSTKQKMKCPFCDTEFDLETLENYDDELNNEMPDDMSWDSSAGGEWQDGEAEGLRVYVCNSCGGEIVADENTAATSCPFCDNPVVIMGQLAGDLKPDLVIPFKLDKESAKAALQKHYKGKPLLPKAFRSGNHIDEVKGIYVPFWLFDADAAASIRYRAERVHMWSDSSYRYTKTDHFLIRRGGTLAFEHVPVDGSSIMADDLMESIEPFNFSDAVDFRTAYLSGYLADKYDVNAEESISRANERIKTSTAQAFMSTVVGYNMVIPEVTNIQLQNGKAKYALYPVWILNTTYNGEKYTFAMNGQTGKMVGDMPTDKGAFARWLIGLTGIIGAVVFGISYLVWLL